MDKPLNSTKLTRILLEVTSSLANSAEYIEIASDFAQALRAELTALFIEEEQLFELSDLPVSCAVQPGTQQIFRLDRQLMEEAVIQQARLFRRTLSKRADEAKLQWSVEVRRGDPLHLIRSSVSKNDIVVLSGTATDRTLHAKLELAWKIGAAAGILVAAPGWRNVRGAITVLQDTRLTAVEEMKLAEQLAAALDEKLVVLQVRWNDAITGRENLSASVHATRSRTPVSLEAIDFLKLSSALRENTPRLLISSLVCGVHEVSGALAHLVRHSRSTAPCTPLRAGPLTFGTSVGTLVR
jgi:hypothetical protein